MEESKQNNYRFDASEVQRLRQKFMKQASKGGEIDVDNFKTIMGILGLESASFLATRIFKAIDKSGDKSVRMICVYIYIYIYICLAQL